MKKILSLLIASAITVGMTATVFAANPKLTAQTSALADVHAGEKAPGDTIWLPLSKDAFEGATEDLTMADVKDAKITVKQSVQAGSKAIESVAIKDDANKKAGILIKLVETFEDTKPIDFETTVYLLIDGKRQGFETIVSGTLTNGEVAIVADTDYVDLSDGRTAKCDETTGKVEVYLGNDVTVFIKMLKGKDYQGTVSLQPDEEDDAIIAQYPDIEEVYSLKSTGLDVEGNILAIDKAEQKYYVYNKEMEFLGDTSELLPYSEKYYLAAKQLEVVTDIQEPSTSEETSSTSSEIDENIENGDLLPAVSPDKGGNPDTGTSPIYGIAIALAAVSLATITVFAFKNLNKKK